MRELFLNKSEGLVSWVGWGTSLAWWGNAVGQWIPSSNRRCLLEAIFSAEVGLGLTVVRYNIGGGENPGHNHMRLWANVPGFLDAAGQWDWNADAAQISVLRDAIGLGVSTVEAFSNAPPYWMSNHPCAAGTPDGQSNLPDSRTSEFADYLVAVVGHFRNHFKIPLHSLSPMNEPQSWWWKAGNNQEGCRFELSQQRDLIASLHTKLQASGLGEVLLSGPEENDLDQNLETLKHLGAGMTSQLGQVNVHSYQGSRRGELRALARNLGLPLWMSEVTVGGSESHNHEDWTSAIELGTKIVADVNELGCQAWVYWQAVEDESGKCNHGLIHADFRGADTWERTRQYWVMAQFSRFIRPGALILNTGLEGTLAAWHPTDKTVTIVVANGSDEDWNLAVRGELSLPNGAKAKGYRTSAKESLTPVDEGFVAKAHAITTWQWAVS